MKSKRNNPLHDIHTGKSSLMEKSIALEVIIYEFMTLGNLVGVLSFA